MKVLFISYYYPPIGTVGTLRVVKFIKYLHRLGCECSVLTIKNVVHHILDESLGDDIPEKTKVYRTFHLEPRTFYRRKIQLNNSQTALSHASRLKNKIIFWSQKAIKFLLIPDELIFWAPFAIYRGIKIVRQEKIEVIISSSPPPTVHIISFFIKLFTRVPWVADFRDEWTNDPGNRPPTKLHRTINSFLEHSVEKMASSITVVTSSIYEEMGVERRRKPEKFSIIYNGFDTEDISSDAKQATKKEVFKIVYSGTFYQHQTPYYFLQALKELSFEKLIKLEKIRFIMYGNIVLDTLGIATLKDPELLGVIEAHPYISHNKLYDLLNKADLLFLVISSKFGLGTFSGKLFEYLGARRFIFGLVPPNGLAADIINRTKTGLAVDPENIPQIKKAFLTVYQQWQNGTFHLAPDEAEILKYSRRNQAEQLLHIFRKIARNSTS